MRGGRTKGDLRCDASLRVEGKLNRIGLDSGELGVEAPSFPPPKIKECLEEKEKKLWIPAGWILLE